MQLLLELEHEKQGLVELLVLLCFVVDKGKLATYA